MTTAYEKNTLGDIREMRSEAAHLSFHANFHLAKGDRAKALPYLDKLKKLFKKSDEKRYAAEDARDSLQKVAAKNRLLGQREGRQELRNKRRRGQRLRKTSTKRLGGRVRLTAPSDK